MCNMMLLYKRHAFNNVFYVPCRLFITETDAPQDAKLVAQFWPTQSRLQRRIIYVRDCTSLHQLYVVCRLSLRGMNGTNLPSPFNEADFNFSFYFCLGAILSLCGCKALYFLWIYNFGVLNQSRRLVVFRSKTVDGLSFLISLLTLVSYEDLSVGQKAA